MDAHFKACEILKTNLSYDIVKDPLLKTHMKTPRMSTFHIRAYMTYALEQLEGYFAENEGCIPELLFEEYLYKLETMLNNEHVDSNRFIFEVSIAAVDAALRIYLKENIKNATDWKI